MQRAPCGAQSYLSHSGLADTVAVSMTCQLLLRSYARPELNASLTDREEIGLPHWTTHSFSTTSPPVDTHRVPSDGKLCRRSLDPVQSKKGLQPDAQTDAGPRHKFGVPAQYAAVMSTLQLHADDILPNNHRCPAADVRKTS